MNKRFFSLSSCLKDRYHRLGYGVDINKRLDQGYQRVIRRAKAQEGPSCDGFYHSDIDTKIIESSLNGMLSIIHNNLSTVL